MASGTPVVAYRAGGIAEYVGDRRAGLVVDPCLGALADACTRLLNDDVLWEDVSRSARHAAKTLYSADAHCDALEEVYTKATWARRR